MMRLGSSNKPSGISSPVWAQMQKPHVKGAAMMFNTKPPGISREVWAAMQKPHVKGATTVFRKGPAAATLNKERLTIRGKPQRSPPRVARGNQATKNAGLRRMYRMFLHNVKPGESLESLGKRFEALRLNRKRTRKGPYGTR